MVRWECSVKLPDDEGRTKTEKQQCEGKGVEATRIEKI
jgi:hypothetical protein